MDVRNLSLDLPVVIDVVDTKREDHSLRPSNRSDGGDGLVTVRKV
ncbi:MAG: hypothetical protein WCH85_03325 [Methanomicrobiales archaeon]